jgi:hypothetical protein
MSSIPDLTARITEQTGVPFEPASAALLAEFESMGAPPALVSFFRRHSPTQIISGQVRLLTLSGVLEENRDLLPGCYASAFGYWTIATSYGGEAYCATTGAGDEDCRVVLLSHAVVDEDTTEEEFARIAKPIAVSLADFLDQFLRDALDEECIY